MAENKTLTIIMTITMLKTQLTFFTSGNTTGIDAKYRFLQILGMQNSRKAYTKICQCRLIINTLLLLTHLENILTDL